MSLQTHEGLNPFIMDTALQVLSGTPVSREQAEQLTKVEGDDLQDLFFWAHKIKQKYMGPHVKFCSIVAGKVGACPEDCTYCSQSSKYKTHVKPSRMTVEEMDSAAQEAAANGANAFGIVNSGRGPTERELDWMEPFFTKTANGDNGHINPCATLGIATPEQAKRLYDMGVRRINHNLETSKRLFHNVTTTHDYQDRVNSIKIYKDAGMHICAGGIFGMGEEWADRIDMAFELRELEVDTVPVNFLYAIPGTKIHGTIEELEPLECLKIIAIYRFILHNMHIKLAGGREKILRDTQALAFTSGASSFLIGNYLTTFGRTPQDDHQLLKDLGLKYMDDEGNVYDPDPVHAGRIAPGSAVEAPKTPEVMPTGKDAKKAALNILNNDEPSNSCCTH